MFCFVFLFPSLWVSLYIHSTALVSRSEGGKEDEESSIWLVLIPCLDACMAWHDMASSRTAQMKGGGGGKKGWKKGWKEGGRMEREL